MKPDAEEMLETGTMDLFQELGWQTANAYEEVHAESLATHRKLYLGREDRGQIVLLPRLRAALERLNPDLPAAALTPAIEELTRDRSALLPLAANRELYHLLRDGVKVTIKDTDGREQDYTVRVVAWNDSEANDFLMVRQLWVTSELYTRRPDLVGFVNGLPLFFGELKAHHKKLVNAYNDNLTDYRDTIPQIFWFNGLALLSNGSEAVVGGCYSPWEHFNAWKKINGEGEEGVISLETAIRGTCEPVRFLDLLAHYVLYHEGSTGLEIGRAHV